MSQDFVNQTDRFGEPNIYYSFPYEHGSEINTHYQHQTTPYFNNHCTGYLARPSQQNLPMRIDMNMTAYVQRPPPLTHHDIYDTTQLPISSVPSTIILESHRNFPYSHKIDMADVGFGEEKCHSGQLQSAHHISYIAQRKMESPVVCQKSAGHHHMKSESGIGGSEKNEWAQSDCSVMKKAQSISKICAKFQCFLCGKKYCRQSTLKAHLRQHSGEKPYVCNICGKNFSQSANLNAHRRVHTGEKPFSCPICSRPFSQSSSLMTHKRTHSGERPYQCTSCDKAFTDSSTLTKHVRTHTGFKPYSCRICHFSFSQSGNLNRHMKTHMKVQDTQQSSDFSSHF